MAHKGTTLSKAFQDTAQAAQNCQSICVQSIQYCLQMGGSHGELGRRRVL